MNALFLIGRLTKDLSLEYKQSGMAVGSTSIAVYSQGTMPEEVPF